MVSPPDKSTLPGLAGNGRGARRRPEPLGRLTRRALRQVAPERQAAHRPWQGGWAAAPPAPPVRLAAGQPPRGPLLLALPAGLCLLRMLDRGRPRALARPRAAGRVRLPPPAARAARGHLGAPAPPPRAAAPLFCPARWRWPLRARGGRAGRRCPRALPLPLPGVGQGGLAPPPTPARARPPRPPQLSGQAARGPRPAPEQRRTPPVHARARAALPERAREGRAGARAGLLLTAGALPAGRLVGGAPRSDVGARPPRPVAGPSLPAPHLEGGLPRCGGAEGGQRRNHRPG